MDRQASIAKVRALREKHQTRRYHKQAVRQATRTLRSPQHGENQEQEPQAAADAKAEAEKTILSKAPVGIYSLPCELTDMIWREAGTWPKKEHETANDEHRPFSLWCTDWISGYTSKRKTAMGEMANLYTLAPAPLAQVCRESRKFSLDQFSLSQPNNSLAKKKLASTKRRWEREYSLPVLTSVLSSTHPRNNWSRTTFISAFHDANHRGNLSLETTSTRAEDRQITLPLSKILKQDGLTYDQMILDLADLNHRSYWAEFMDGNPLGTYAHALFDLLISAKDGQILVTHPIHVSYEATSEDYVENPGNNRSRREWEARSQNGRYVPIDDVAVFRDLQRTFGGNNPVTHVQWPDVDPNQEAEERAFVRTILGGSREEREKLKEEALRPLRELWETIGRERDFGSRWTWGPPPPLPRMDVVVKVDIHLVRKNGLLRSLDDWRVLRSRTPR